MNYALGIDIGATNIKAVAVSPAGKLLTEVNTPTGDTGSKSWMGNVLLARQRVHDTMNAVPKWTGLAAPGLAAKHQRSIRHMPGRLAGLEGLNWQKAFQAKGMVPVLNDAHAALLGELWQGAASPVHFGIALIVSCTRCRASSTFSIQLLSPVSPVGVLTSVSNLPAGLTATALMFVAPMSMPSA